MWQIGNTSKYRLKPIYGTLPITAKTNFTLLLNNLERALLQAMGVHLQQWILWNALRQEARGDHPISVRWLI